MNVSVEDGPTATTAAWWETKSPILRELSAILAALFASRAESLVHREDMQLVSPSRTNSDSDDIGYTPAPLIVRETEPEVAELAGMTELKRASSRVNGNTPEPYCRATANKIQTIVSKNVCGGNGG